MSKENILKEFIKDIETITSSTVIGLDFIALGDDDNYFYQDYLLHSKEITDYLRHLDENYFSNNPSLLITSIIEKLEKVGCRVNDDSSSIHLNFEDIKIAKSNFTKDSIDDSKKDEYWNKWLNSIKTFYSNCCSIYFLKEDFGHLVQTSAIFLYFKTDVTSLDETKKKWLKKSTKALLFEEAVSVFLPRHIQQIRGSATRAAISQVMARNTSHNIGAHVMNKLVDSKFLANLDVNQFNLDKPNSYQSNELKDGEDDKFKQIAYFNNYVKCRMDYLADITFGTPLMQTNKFASDLFKEVDKVRLLLEHITGLSDFNYKINFKKNGKSIFSEKGEINEDVLVAIPNDILGMQAFYNILENIIRNTAKHAQVKPTLTEFTVNFIDTPECADNQEQTNILNDLIAVEVYDNIPIVDEKISFSDIKSNFKALKEYKINTKISKIEKIDYLVCSQNNKINADILEDDGKKLRVSSLGVIEMDASSAYLRKRNVSFINHDHYNVEHNDCWSCNTGENRGNDSKPLGTKCRNFLKAFKAKINASEYALGYRFFLLRPQVVLIITELNITEKVELRKQGVWLVTTDEFKKHLTDGSVFNHEFVLYDKSDNAIDAMCKKYKTSLPLRILKIENSSLVSKFEEIKKVNVFNYLNYFEEFCWKEWDNRVLELKYYTESFYPYKGEKESNNCNHSTGYMSGIESGMYFYYDALSSQGQSKLPNFNGDLGDYSGEFESNVVVKTKVGESIYSRILVIDERIQENSKKKYLEIPISKLYEMTGILVPDKSINLSANELDKNIILKEIRKYISSNINTFSEVSNEEQKYEILNANFDFILIHYSILERIFNSNKNQINDFLIELSYSINVVITSGRGEPEALPIQVRYMNLSTVVHSMVETRSKFFTNYIMHASRKSSKLKL